MAHIHIKEEWKISENLATPESAYMRRREFLKGTALTTAATVGALYGCGPSSLPKVLPEVAWSELEKSIYPAKKNPHYELDRPLTAERIAATTNNFYEFGSEKSDPVHYAQKLKIRPWTLEVGGLVNKPKTFAVEDLLKTMPLEERLYRLRCVEAWAMAVPWTGFPLHELLKQVEPKPEATHVRLETFYAPFTAQGQLEFWEPWPYVEGLTLNEAMNELAFLATGIYGHPLPKQHGAPVRLVVPWKYGFKNIKSIVKIELVNYRPATFWNTLQGLEYDFTANVDPGVPHPRWPQTREKMIGTGDIRPTLLYNGYEKFVANLYS
ncbi:MAG: protein-methionine-sulfoxide reductase catalytic subunit MsrP [Nitrospina sp.]|jgi:methionine sulfoxide reductase catalytic subunit|nr:protein-methionine-sulfoxide reductase catalytic subunit MsrP [Nitrospina sp.]MBT3415971.1 protein-methionine-sulfoxide reductase catalytic subunit MsrP [Nitrospina sp.]MBT3856753.1 protein-methionine-sulfoxide reductase catalytic subunit MsrP [Nitrospina sp.]MBT4103431.1 protein-methionine-sulfoxide reductase catalytic subunit MsrP [Nitrospina sp.]MBT4390610.1 protein-methionine-sulfoxide reductase catalytic subunit MsrP [Nitrospina sp.]